MPSFPTAEETATSARSRPPVVPPFHESRSDLEIMLVLATRLGLNEHFFSSDIDVALNCRLAPSGLTVRQLRANRIGMHAEAETRYKKYSEVDPQRDNPRISDRPRARLKFIHEIC